jgi:metallo-beta-lactamase class B
MKQCIAAVSAAFGIAAGGPVLIGQTATGEIAAHVAAAEKASAGQFDYIVSRICPQPPAANAANATSGGGAPARETWYQEPAKVFDNLYYIGTKVHGAWALTTSAGIIVFDALYDYAVIDEVEAGLKKVGLDPTEMKYLIISHGHGDHHGGTRYLQDKYRPKVVMGPKDWELVARDTRSPRPTRDVDATDGQQITLGDTTITLYITPGHTGSTISTVIPVKDGATTHTAVSWGGTAISERTPIASVHDYSASAARFRRIAADARADVLYTNHTAFDNTLDKLAALRNRAPGAPHPFVVGPQVVDRYLTVAEECAKALAASRK